MAALKDATVLQTYANNVEELGQSNPSLYGLVTELQSYVFQMPRTATASSYSVLSTDKYVGVTSTASARTITLPAPAAQVVVIVKDESGAAGTNHITVAPHASETIDGGSSSSISTNYGVVRLVSDGTNWFTW